MKDFPLAILVLVASSPKLSSRPLIQMPICKFFSKGGCARGDQCYYQHVQSAAAQQQVRSVVSPANRALSWRTTRNEETAPARAFLASFPDPVAEVSCRYFSIGACKNGDNCRFRHEATSEDTLPPAVPQHGSNDQLTDERQDEIATDERNPFPSFVATNIKPTEPTTLLSGLADPLIEVSCRFFNHGTCRNGDNCRFRHETAREEEPEEGPLPLQARIAPFDTNCS